MEAEHFDALTKRLATGTSRRRLLTGLGGALAGTASLGGGIAAAASSCGETYLTCLNQAGVASAEAQRACRAAQGQTYRSCLDQAGVAPVQAERACRSVLREGEEACLDEARAAERAASAACRTAYMDCVAPPCLNRGQRCSRNSQCCSGQCGLVIPPPVSGVACE